MNVLLIPCWNRPEFLWHCLDNLTKCEGIKDVLTIFKPDHGHNLDNLKVIDEYRDRLGPVEIHVAAQHYNRTTKQSSNVLTGYLTAANRSNDLVFMVEEDVMVARDFFRFHEAVHEAEPNLFCSLSTENHNRKVTVTTDPDAYYLTTLDYCSLGTCFKRGVILEHIQPHVKRDYFKSPMNYVYRTFTHSVLNRSMCEQDGLIRRIQERRPDLPIAYPHVPRAFHSGYYGYNRPRQVGGTLADKIRNVGSIIYNDDAVRRTSLRPEYYTDSRPVELDTPEWTTLRNVPAA